MRKISIILLVLILSGFSLFACSEEGGDIPEGLQLVMDSKEDGYTFYGPEGWMIINSADIAATKVSSINNTSITFVEADMPIGTVPEYFEESLSEFPESIKETMNITLRDSECSFGNANGKSYKYVYTYHYEEYDFACMQILTTHNDSFYIFTYTSYGDMADENSNYQQYLESVQLAIDNFVFTEKSTSSEPPVYEKDSDGYNLVSDRDIAGFDLYLPEDYEVVYSSAYVKAKISEGANISLSKATSTGVSISAYWDMRKEQLGNIVTDIEEIKVNEVNSTDNITVKLGDLDISKVAAYEYRYTFNENVYHVYQVMGVDLFNGYVLTYTALDGEYDEHIDEIKTILEKVRF